MITAVGTRGELGSDDHYDESAILPGFVDAHTHLEYDVYAGFGDGLGFADWIGLHVERKLRIELEDMEAIARLGALDCLRSGITTVGDCSFSGAAVTACADLGLKGTIYLEVFGPTDSPIRERFEPMRERIAAALSDDVRLGVSPHAPYTCTIDLYRASAELGLPVATHLAESDDETEFLRTGRGGWESFADMLVPPPGTTGIRALAEAGLLDSNVIAAHCVKADEEEIEILAAHDVAVAHCPRSNGILGCGVAPLTALREGRHPRLHRHRQPRLDTVVRHVRRDARGDRGRASTRGPARCSDRCGRARARNARRRPRARAWTRHVGRSSSESRLI